LHSSNVFTRSIIRNYMPMMLQVQRVYGVERLRNSQSDILFNCRRLFHSFIIKHLRIYILLHSFFISRREKIIIIFPFSPDTVVVNLFNLRILRLLRCSLPNSRRAPTDYFFLFAFSWKNVYGNIFMYVCEFLCQPTHI